MTAPATPTPADAVPESLTEPRARDWDDDPRTCARYDRAWGDNDYDIHRDEE